MKRCYALITAAFMLIFSLTALAQGFSDMPSKDSPYYEAMDYAVKNNIISGYGGKINPDSLITKAEAVTILSRVISFGADSADLSKVTDISPDDWYYPIMAKAVRAGVITINSDNTLKPLDVVLEKDAADMVAKSFKTTLSPTAANASKTNNAVTRAVFIQMVYSCIKYTASAEHNTENPTQAPTEVSSESGEFSQLRAEQAREAMQVALGILPDGTSYVDVAVYTDKFNTDWASDRVTGSSRPQTNPSRPSNPGGNDDDEPEQPATEAPTNPPSDEPTEAPNNPTEPPTQEPSYGNYDGPIDNDKDNVIEDPFDDGWRPPGWIDDNDEGQGGYDEEDDFLINDDDDPEYVDKTEPSTEDVTEPPSQEETEVPTQDATEAETDSPSDNPTEAETEFPSDNTTEFETDSPSDYATEYSSDYVKVPEESQNPISQILSFFSKVWWFS